MKKIREYIAFGTMLMILGGQVCNCYAEESISDNKLLRATYETVKMEVQEDNQDAAENESVSDNQLSALPDQEENPVIQIEIPTKLPFMIDPFELGGYGQIYSTDFYITNKSNFPIDINISDVTCTANDDTIKLSDTPIASDSTSTEKEIYLFMKWAEKQIGEGGEITNAYVNDSHEADSDTDVLTADKEWAPKIIHLEPQENIMFKLDGSITTMAEKSWKDKDISIELRYSCDINSEEKESVSENALSVSENALSISENELTETVSENKVTEDKAVEDKVENTETKEVKSENVSDGKQQQVPETSEVPKVVETPETPATGHAENVNEIEPAISTKSDSGTNAGDTDSGGNTNPEE